MTSDADGVPAEDSGGTVILALVSNLGIAVAKGVAGALSGSAAMLSESAHSLGDTVNALSNVYVPCGSATITVAGNRLPGRPDVRTGPRTASTAFLAEAEVWSD